MMKLVAAMIMKIMSTDMKLFLVTVFEPICLSCIPAKGQKNTKDFRK